MIQKGITYCFSQATNEAYSEIIICNLENSA